MKAEVSIAFPVEKFKESLEVEMDEIQMSLFVDNSEGAHVTPPAELGDPMGVTG